ncbi:MAG: protein kinase [Bacteroidales bacterium]|jgi:serine/threonine protein kinase|nr:protein kinase [Bacteroidales bacterium]
MLLQENTLFHSHYLLKKLLGRGGFSEVWLVENTLAGNIKMALKIYAPGAGLDDDGVSLFSKEFELVFNINHTNLLRTAHFDVCDRSPYLVMPYCEQGSAGKLIGNITEEQAWNFLHDVAAGLAHLHKQNPPIIHQDIKPDNVLIDNSGQYLITDFGISTKARNTLRKSIEQFKKISGGTIAYMGPERFGKDNLPIKASDIWALGATLFELMSGDTPFSEHGGLIQKSGAEIPDIDGEYSENLKKVVYACLAENPWDRPTAKILMEWKKEEVSPQLPQPKPPKPKQKHPKRKKILWFVLGGIAIATAIATFLFYSQVEEYVREVWSDYFLVEMGNGQNELTIDPVDVNEETVDYCDEPELPIESMDTKKNDQISPITEQQKQKEEKERADYEKEQKRQRLEKFTFFEKNLGNNYMVVQQKSNSLWGIIDKNGNIIVSCTYTQASKLLKNGCFALKHENGKWDIFDTSAKKINYGLENLNEYQ